MKRNCIGNRLSFVISTGAQRNGETFHHAKFENIKIVNVKSKDFSAALEMTKVAKHLQRALLLTIVLFVASCQQKPENDHHDLGKVEVDSALKALIQPSNQQVVAKATVVKASYETKIITAEVQGIVNYDNRGETSVASRVSGRLERLNIKYNYQPVRKGQLLFEIYTPDLAAAQQELIYLSQRKEDEHLLAQAKQRLLLLGMTAKSVQQVLQTKKVNYRIPVYSPADGFILEKTTASNASISAAPASTTNGDGMAGMGTSNESTSAAPVSQNTQNTPVMLREGQYVNAGQSLFTIYKANQLLAEFALKPSLAGFVKRGTKLAFYKTADKEGSFQTSAIGLIQPIIKAGENFTMARIYITGSNFKVGEILTAKIPVIIPSSFWLPESAVVSVGAQVMVFKKENDVFVPKNITVGVRMNGLVQVKQDISNWKVAKNAAYLVDSESFIKSK